MPRETQRWYQVLHQVASTVNSSLELPQVLEAVVESAAQAMDCKASSLRLLSPRRRRLLMSAAYGLTDAYLRKGPVEVEKSGVDREALEGKVVIIRDAATDPLFQYPEEAAKEHIASVLVVPLEIRGKPIGVLRVYTDQPRDFDPDEVEFLQAIADLSAIAIENARLHQSLRADFDALTAFEYRLFDL